MSEVSLRGLHYDFIKARVPAWFNQASGLRQQELGTHTLRMPAWYLAAGAGPRRALSERHGAYRDAMNLVENTLGQVQDVLQFAEPLLKAAIRLQFKQDLDVRNVFFARKYGFKNRDDFYGFFAFEQQSGSALNHVYRGMSLLEAALANFAPDEAHPSRCNDCQVITRWGSHDGDVIATWAAVNAQAVAIAPDAFAKLCRTLDLGGLYRAHLKAIFEPADTQKRTGLERQMEDYQRQQLGLCSEIARQQLTIPAGGTRPSSGISADAYWMLQQVLKDRAGVVFDGKPVTFAVLKVFDIELTGPLLIGADRKSSSRNERVLVYLPNDPEQPLKEYASSGEFMADLRARLHRIEYRRFFSRFVPKHHQGRFFQKFDRLYRPSGAAAQSDYPVTSRLARLPLDEKTLAGNLWQQLRQRYIHGLYADAQAIAVPTDEEDRLARMARFDSYVDAVLSVFNLAAFVVPGLGPLMLAVGALQMSTELFEGLESYEEGDLRQMWAHLSSVALNAAFFAAGAKVLPEVQVAGFADGFKPVALPGGKRKLWKPDLAPYKTTFAPAADARPDALGLHAHDGQTFLRLDGDAYRVSQHPRSGEYRILHPSRTDAYGPRLRHNGQGAWHHELERPLKWQTPQLLRRLGPMVEGFDDVELEQIRQVSGVSADELRRVHVEGEPVPAILRDTLLQFRAYTDAIKVARGIHDGALPAELCEYAVILATELRGWPSDKAIEVFSGNGVDGTSARHGNALAAEGDTLRISRAQLMNGELPARIVAFLNEPQIKAVLPGYTPTAPEARALELQKKLEAAAVNSRARLMRSLYNERVPKVGSAAATLQRDFRSLPPRVADELLAAIKPVERQALGQGRVPLRVAELARRMQQHMRLTVAYEGLYLDALANADTETLVLNTLANLPGWQDDIRLEVRTGEFGGELRASFGPQDASERKVLVQVGDGRYQARDAQDQHLHGSDDLYASLQHALPDAHRKALGVPHTAQGAQLKALVIEHALPRDTLRTLLKMQPVRRGFFRAPIRLPGGRIGYPLSNHGQSSQWRHIIEERVRTLYPGMNEVQMREYLRGHNLADDGWLKALETEYKQLDSILSRWLVDGPKDREALRLRRRIYDTIRGVWRKTGEWDLDTSGNYRGQKITLEDPALGAQLATLPPLPGNFDHVTSLHFPACGLTDQATAFLSSFRALRILNLEGNRLTLLPEVCANMPYLEGLELSDNAIVLTADSALLLRNMHRLEWLAMQGNPLSRPVDISRMPRLKWLYLSGCDLHEWPPGLFASPRPRDFLLELTGNRLTAIPDVAPGSDRARILARTAVTRDWLTPEVDERLRLYIESVGLDPERRFPPRGAQDSANWMSGLTQQQWLDRQEMWNTLEDAPGSEPFFDEIRKLSEHLDERTEGYKKDLTAKVWRMLEAMANDSNLRERLFQMAVAPTTCVDAGAQLFNAMGVEVLLSEALSLPNTELMNLELLALAKGKARLDELGRIAHARVSELVAQGRRFPEYDADGNVMTHYGADGRPVPSIDEVEIHLAYVTRLANRLDLPWQTAMFFEEPDVTPAMLEAAYKRVIALEAGDLLRNNIVEQPFWADYVQTSYAHEFDAVSAKNEALINLYAAQEELAANGTLSDDQKAQLQRTIDASAQVLGKSPRQVSAGPVMSDEEYFSEMETLGEERRNVLRTVTDRVMGRGSARPGPQP
ncbi:MAG: hypothetical protein GAK37_01732 [Pseudomonas sp.]|nr:MAG: hypothetical protein GAK37_01732 [Pseudomonas sp.]